MKLRGSENDSQHEQPIVAIVDPDASLRHSLSEVLQDAHLTVAGYESAESLLGTIDDSVPACIVSEIDLPGTSGLELQAQLARRLIRSPVVFVVARLEPRRVVEALKAGAFDVLMKPIDPESFVQCVQRAVGRSARIGDMEIRHASIRARLADLTPRELEILELAIAGLPNKEIARELAISYRTVEVHRRQILRKTGAASLLAIAGLTSDISGDERLPSRHPSATPEDKPPP